MYHRRFVIRVFSLIAALLVTACRSATPTFPTATSDVAPPAAEATKPDGEPKTAEGETVTDSGSNQKGATTTMTAERFDNIIPLQRALILRNEEKMGMVFQSIRAEITEELRRPVKEGVQISSGKILEDYYDTDNILLLFPAEPINGLMGQFILILSVQSVDPTTPGVLEIRQAEMVQDGVQFSVQLEMKANAPINQRWAYTKHPDMRQVYVAMFDDPDTLVEGEVFHLAVLPTQSSTPQQARGQVGWTTLEFSLDPQLIEQSQVFDQCETLIEALDEEFTAKTGQYLQWSRPLVTLDTIEAVASTVENRQLQKGNAFNITLELPDQEITRGKRIRSLMQYPLTLIDEDGARRAGTIGCSISKL